MNISKDTIKKLKNEFQMILFRDSKSYRETNPLNGDLITIAKSINDIKSFKTPKSKEVTFSWVMHKYNKESIFMNLSKYCEKLIDANYFSCYPASYGFGVETLFCKKDNSINKIVSFLNENNIEYYNEYSDAFWVYRFKISKSEENINRLKSLLN